MAPMSTSKRRLRALTDDGTEIGGIENGNSGKSRRDSRKKPRLSHASDDESDSSQLVDSTDDMDTDDGNQDDVRDLSDEAAIRRMGDLRERQTNTENIPAENAIIEEIICTNFMCHAHLQIKVGPLINFIIGHNGSGKSAVLSALTVCLGGKATATNRSQSLKGFIKEGCEASTLSVRIKNQGVSSYKQDVYGASIIVERHFSRSGASGFKIKNANGKIITTKKSDLDDILDFYALQLDNPMNVLTQDMARQFLNSSSSQDKYKFFHRGTQLETLDNDYQEIERTLDTIQPKMRHIQEQKAATKAAYDRARKAAELVAGQQRTVNAIKRLEWEMAWAQVEEQENILEDADNEIKELDVTMEEQKEKANDMERKFSHAEQSVEQATGAIASLEAELQPHQEKKTEVTTIFQAQVDELQGLIHQQREIRTELKVAQSDVQKYTGLIQAEEEKLRNADDGRPAQIHAEIQECKSTLEEANQAKDSIDSQGRDLKQDAEGAQNQKKRAAQTAQEISDDFQKQNRRIKEVEKENGKINLHPNIQRLMTAITRDSRFRVKPVGPVSQHVHLLKPEWSSILERQAGMMLDAFCVTSKADEAILTELLRRHECTQVRVMIGDPRPINTSANEPDASLTTWMKVLRIDSDLVRNQLIINQRIDQTVLIQSRQDAVDFLAQRPAKVGQVFCFQDDQTGPKRGSGHRITHASGGPNMGPILAWKNAPRMAADVQSRLRAERDTLEALKQDARNADKTYQDAKDRERDIMNALARHERHTMEQKVMRQRLEDKISRLKEDLELATPQTGLMNRYKEELEAAEEKSELFSNQYQDSVTAKDSLNEKQREIRNQQSAIDADMQVIEKKKDKAVATLQSLLNAREDSLKQKNLALQWVKESEQRREAKLTERAELLENVKDFMAEATKICDRVPVEAGVSSAMLNQRHEKMSEQLARAQREQGGSEEELKQKELETKEAYEKIFDTLEQLNDLTQTLKHSLVNRRERWEKFREFISIRAKTSFTYLLSERQFRGTLLINHLQKALDIQVEPDITRKSDKGRQTKTLSGGEKSFSTICLLLALWEAMGSPIRCLDEFDVFMDNVNRDVSMRMMIQAARQAVSRQFILITPQSMNNVAVEADVKIHKMRDPERGQTALPFVRV